jgi:hypothetical protein
MPFSEEDDPKDIQKVCSKQACAIQYCLVRYNHQERYCQAVIDEWKKCRDKVTITSTSIARTATETRDQ